MIQSSKIHLAEVKETYFVGMRNQTLYDAFNDAVNITRHFKATIEDIKGFSYWFIENGWHKEVPYLKTFCQEFGTYMNSRKPKQTAVNGYVYDAEENARALANI